MNFTIEWARSVVFTIHFLSWQAEQKAIFESNSGGNRPLTWDQTRNMPLTYRVRTAQTLRVCPESASWTHFSAAHVWNFQVILESLRMASIISFTFREAVVDVEYKGKDSKKMKLTYGYEFFLLLFLQYILNCSGNCCRISHSKRLEGDATVQEHSSQSGILLWSSEFRSI